MNEIFKQVKMVMIAFALVAIFNSCEKENYTEENIKEVINDESINPSRLKDTESGSYVSDVEGNLYGTVIIGSQLWMAQNLITTKYRNGDPIMYPTSSQNWYNFDIMETGAYFWFDHDKRSSYGALYNWYTVLDSRNVAPQGWHVPTIAEYDVLINYLGGDQVAGGKLKRTDAGWNQPNVGATNSSGFSAMGGGITYSSPTHTWFLELKDRGEYWASDGYKMSLLLKNDQSTAILTGHVGGNSGISIRCVRDEPVAYPQITTNGVVNSSGLITSGGNISTDNGSVVSERGVCWINYPNPVKSEESCYFTIDGSGVGNYSSILTELNDNTTYYIRAYATNKDHTVYGNEVSFTTDFQEPINVIEEYDGDEEYILSWDPVPDAVGYKIYVSHNSGGSFGPLKTLPNTLTSFERELKPHYYEIYRYKVCALFSSGESEAVSPPAR